MIGAWAGRQAEEELAQGFNRMLVDRLWDSWQKGKSAGRSSEFVDLSDPDLKDPIQVEAWKLMPVEMRDYVRQKFGEDGFKVRRDMVNNAVGYRAALADEIQLEHWPMIRDELAHVEKILGLIRKIEERLKKCGRTPGQPAQPGFL